MLALAEFVLSECSGDCQCFHIIIVMTLQIGDVRLCCLKCLQPLYDSEDLAPKLELFTNRFKVVNLVVYVLLCEKPMQLMKHF